MGLFSKKEYVCEKCGKTFTTRLEPYRALCRECSNQEFNEEEKLKKLAKGYLDYDKVSYNGKLNTIEDYRNIVEHRNNIINKYKVEDGITRSGLQKTCENVESLTDIQSFNVLNKIRKYSIVTGMGSGIGGSFFLPTQFEGTIVDSDDIFAIAYTEAPLLSDSHTETIMVAFFTNDPYIPAFPLLVAGKKSFFESKSKEVRSTIVSMFTNSTINRTYPVCDIKELKKTIKKEGSVRGNIEYKKMLSLISNASSNVGVFRTKDMHEYLLPGTLDLLDQIGYMDDETVYNIMHVKNRKADLYWQKQENKFAKLG